ncbi:MAG: hypothetical protein B6D64_01095 [Bacteroidetes bacterium 4484_276]|nr:MAG: hypothetical protein B6D64_01095 [Bacteroidetes bacterium 4484_276]
MPNYTNSLNTVTKFHQIKTLRKGIFIILLLLIISSLQGYGQRNEILITKEYNDLPWKEFVEKVENDFKARFFYNPDSIPEIIISVKTSPANLQGVLTENFSPYGINISIDRFGNIFVTKGQTLATALPSGFFEYSRSQATMPDTLELSSAQDENFLKTNDGYVAQSRIVGTKKEGLLIPLAEVYGYVISLGDSSPIIGATVYVGELGSGSATNDKGFYTLILPKGKYTMTVRSVGFEEIKYKVEVLSGGHLDFHLPDKIFMMEAVEISSQSHHNVRGIQMGFEKLTTNDIKEIPVVLGERDIIKVALLLPGVQQVGEGTAGFNVRGSPADQNLFYLSNIPVYNTSHLFGFFSAFNPDAISDFTLYKSNIPAKYGGRLSSIFDISARQGNPKKFSARGGISPITARILVEGPAIKDKLNYMVGFRSTYSDWVLNFVTDPDVKNSKANFADAIVNLSYQVNPKNQLKFISYYSRDNISLASKVDDKYSNAGASLSWYHTFGTNHDFNFSLAYGKYNFSEDNYEYSLAAYSLGYELQHYGADMDFSLKTIENHTITYGINSVIYKIDNGDQLPLDENSLIVPVELGKQKGLEASAYVGDEWKIHPKLTLYGGLRYNNYSYLGPNTVFSYQEGQPKNPDNIIDTLTFSNNEVIENYDGLDLRLAATYLINPGLSVKFSYNTLHQYIFMLSNTIALSPTDKWQLCSNNIQPMWGNQFSLGLYSNIGYRVLEVSVEGYYKKVQNLVEYKDGANLVVNEHPEMDVLQGELESYGIELMVKKPYGKLNGWINYTYSKATVVVDNEITGENNNFGQPYPANYDKPHSLNIVANYKISKRLSFSGNMVYSTGRPITYPTAIYYQDGQKILNYSLRNEYRIPDYFRIDLSLKWEGNLKRKKFLHGSWIFSVYNLTGRKNAYSVYFKSEQGQINGYKLSIFGVPVFSVTYDFKLGNYAD